MTTIHTIALATFVAVSLEPAHAAPGTRHPALLVHQAPGTGTGQEARWAPWLGCWQLTEETADDGSRALAEALGLALPQTITTPGVRVCVTPVTGGATMTTRLGERTALTETIVADGVKRPVAEPDCQGWQRAEWSSLGPRVFARAEVTCKGQPTRTVSGLALMMAGPTWIDIQLIESDGRKMLRARRYTRAGDPQPSARAATPPPRRLSIADVKEASAKVSPDVLEAALVDIRAPFDLTGKRLIELDEAGVPDSVIDLMVALSFPERFVVERPVARGGGGSWWWPGFDDFGPYFAYPYYHAYHYAPFGYRYWGYDNYYFNGPGFVVINPGGSTTVAATPSGDGRVVDGRGYTRVRRNDPAPVIPRGGDSSTASSSGGSSSTVSGSSGVSSGGYSSGGGGGGGRTAQPRPPGTE